MPRIALFVLLEKKISLGHWFSRIAGACFAAWGVLRWPAQQVTNNRATGPAANRNARDQSISGPVIKSERRDGGNPAMAYSR
jgi:hypothetical protein